MSKTKQSALLTLDAIDLMRADLAKALAAWRTMHPGEYPPSSLGIGGGFRDHIFRGTPRIGDWFCNVYAGEANPERIGMFLTRHRRDFELTNCRGKFWRIPADVVVMIETPADAPLVRRDARRNG